MSTTPQQLLAVSLPRLAVADRFEILPYDLDVAAGTLEVHYRLLSGDDELARFAERVELSESLVALGEGRQADEGAWHGVARLVALAAGTSYYKVAAPALLAVTLGPITDAEAEFVRALYDHGLREFAARNDLPVPLVQAWELEVGDPPHSQHQDPQPSEPQPSEPRHLDPGTALVPVGGGKDSALVLSVLGEVAVPFTVNASVAPRRVAAAAGLPLHTATRRLDPALRTWNEGGALNGHIPVTAVVTAISALAALAAGCRDVVLGNERSASEPTRWVGGEPVNHQWAKSLDAEDLTQAALAAATGGRLRTFSILRPFTEVAIAGGLVTDPAQLDAFLSCNEAFTMWRETDQRAEGTWCLNCPKCRFTTLMLAPHLDPERFEATFGGRPLHDPAQADGYRALWDEAAKPYECVGEMVESAAAMAELAQRSEWADAPVVRATGASAAAYAAEHGATLATLEKPTDAHRVPAPYLRAMLARLAPGARSA
ncbi:MAG: hypothetical protein R2754_15760 [Microthrixaceae bacterium]